MEQTYLILDHNEICRFCLGTDGILSDVTAGPIGLIFFEQLQELFNLHINNIEIARMICHRCRFKIEMLYDFKMMVVESSKTLETENVEVVQVSTADSAFVDEFDVEKQVKQDGIDTDHQHSEIMHTTTTQKQGQDTAVIKMNTIICKRKMLQPKQKRIDRLKSYKSETDKHKKSIYPTMNEANKQNQCLLCFEKFPQRNILYQHVEKHIEGTKLQAYFKVRNKNVTCNECQKPFKYRYSLLIHQREHLNLKPYVCTESNCSMAYSSGLSLLQHAKYHGNRDFACISCGVAFKRKYELNQHNKIHEDEGLVYICSVCGAFCKNRITHRAHMKKHSKKPNFKCEHCSKNFYNLSELQRHKLRHSNIKQFNCGFCDKSYYSRSALQRHLKTNHSQSKDHEENDQSITCKSGSNVFEDNVSYDIHLAECSLSPIPCRANTRYNQPNQCQSILKEIPSNIQGSIKYF